MSSREARPDFKSPPGSCDAHFHVFGPAGRALPQLPLQLAAYGTLEAAGRMSGPVGPAWWGVSES